MKLPKLYRVVRIRFWSLRPSIGCCGGVDEIDSEVVRKARRVLCDEGWQWQLLNSELPVSLNDNDFICLNDNPSEFIVLGEDK